jgi:hypothetical protein
MYLRKGIPFKFRSDYTASSQLFSKLPAILTNKKKAKSNKTQPDPDCISLSAHSAYTIYSNGKLGES